MALTTTTLRFRANFAFTGVYIDYAPALPAAESLVATIRYRKRPHDWVEGHDFFDITGQSFLATCLFGLAADTTYDYAIQLQRIVTVGGAVVETIDFSGQFTTRSDSFATSAGTEYFLSPAGSDSNGGLSAADPIYSLGKFDSLASAGDIATMAGGDYCYGTDDTLRVCDTVAGTAEAPITIRGSGVGGKANITGASAYDPGDWSVHSGDIYVCDTTVPSNALFGVLRDTTANRVLYAFLALSADKNPVEGGGDASVPWAFNITNNSEPGWHMAADGTLYVRMYDGASPEGRLTACQGGAGSDLLGIKLKSDYWYIDGTNITFSDFGLTQANASANSDWKGAINWSLQIIADNCWVHDAAFIECGMRLNGASYTTIEDNSFTADPLFWDKVSADWEGYGLGSAYDFQVGWRWGYGGPNEIQAIKLIAASTESRQTVIRNNTFDYIEGPLVATTVAMTDIDIYGNTLSHTPESWAEARTDNLHNVRIDSNTVDGTFYSVRATDADQEGPHWITNNWVDNYITRPFLQGNNSTGPVVIAHNTFRCTQVGEVIGRCCWGNAGFSNHEIANNIFIGTNLDVITGMSGAMADTFFKNNAFYSTSSATQRLVIGGVGYSSGDLAVDAAASNAADNGVTLTDNSWDVDPLDADDNLVAALKSGGTTVKGISSIIADAATGRTLAEPVDPGTFGGYSLVPPEPIHTMRLDVSITASLRV